MYAISSHNFEVYVNPITSKYNDYDVVLFVIQEVEEEALEEAGAHSVLEEGA